MLATPIVRGLVIVILVSGAGAAWAKKADKPAADTSLVLGDSYTIWAEQHGARQRFEGQLVKLNDHWIVLRHVSQARSGYSVPVLSIIPGIGQKFRSPAVIATDEYLWIPRQVARVETRKPAGQVFAAVALGEVPPMQVSCAVEVAQGQRVVRRDGGMQAMTDQHVTIAIPRKVSVDVPSPLGLSALFSADAFGKKKMETRYTREQLPLADILCIRVANYDPSVLTAQAH